ncbi:CBS domain-containing protein [Myxococcus llanfairpwllgwyngyllgogerychwyrndrobwllllantysiliogogogochensis]|nr:CBS domain-containing protein [Myxococcus llanfairpwllgwyngyllgogerychwyrndrobwllllantysiliogogogochensis]
MDVRSWALAAAGLPGSEQSSPLGHLGWLVGTGGVSSLRGMAHRSLDNGKGETLGPSRPGLGTEPARAADAAPPGSRERGESDVSGWNPARDESPSVREGRFYRGASQRMAQPRTDVEDRGGAAWASGGVRGGPYGRDDRDDRYATGIGPRPRMGEHDRELAPQPAEYRAWDRTGYGGQAWDDEDRARREARSRRELSERSGREPLVESGEDRAWREEQARRERGGFEDRPRRESRTQREFSPPEDYSSRDVTPDQDFRFEARSRRSTPSREETAAPEVRSRREVSQGEEFNFEARSRGSTPSRKETAAPEVRSRREVSPGEEFSFDARSRGSTPSREEPVAPEVRSRREVSPGEEFNFEARSRGSTPSREETVGPEVRSRREVSPGEEFNFEARPRRAPSDERSRQDERQREERTRAADHIREDRSQDFRASPLAEAERRRWQREPLTAREVMTRNVRTARRDSSLREVARLMKEEDCGVIPIVNEHGRLEGIVTDRDIAIQAFSGGQPPEQLRASDVMTDDVPAATPDETLHTLVDIMAREQIRRVPVVERDDRLIGIVTMGDIAKHADADEELQRALERISSRRSFWSRLR